MGFIIIVLFCWRKIFKAMRLCTIGIDLKSMKDLFIIFQYGYCYEIYIYNFI